MINQFSKISPTTSKNRREMLTSALRHTLTILSLLFLLTVGYSQNSGLTEEDIIANAQNYFDKENYQEALPLFAQLVSVHPENPEYNYKFGVCTLYGDRSDRRRPIRYLTIALRSIKDDPQLHYHLGIAYYQNQEFADAMKYLNLYLAKLGSDSPERPVILEKVNACLNGMNLEHKNVISDIISTSEFNMDNFHRAYRADEFSGMLILKPEMFLTSKEKKSGENSFVYISDPRRLLYYSGYDGNTNQRDLFMVEMTENGDWGDPVKLPESINTSFDEDYPIGVNGGLTLYFCSKGHNSLGGFDVYKTTLDTVNNIFSEPENLGVGINSPFDDLLFIPDKTGQFAYFSTNRDNLNGTINVYKIRLIENSLEQNQFLAENVIKANLGHKPEPQKTTHEVSTQQIASNNSTPSRKVVSKPSKPELSPAERAAKMKNERNVMNNYADTSYQLVTETKNLIRDLTNKRDRANAVSLKKQEAAKSLEVKFEELMASLASVESDVEFEKMLQNSMILKQEIYQYRQRADQANLVAWNLGKHIKVKSQELESIKAGAGKVQTNSVAGKIEETRIAYLDLRSSYNLGDTLTDYTDLLFALTSDEKKYSIPQSELAYVEDLRKSFENNTLMAAANKANQKPVQEDIPIVVVDKRTQFVEQPKPRPTITPEPLVESISVKDFAQSIFIEADESLEVDFSIDAITPEKLVELVSYEALASTIAVDETELELNLQMDLPEIIPVVEPVIFALIDPMPEDESLEIDLVIDAIEPYDLVKPVQVEWMASNIDIDETELVIDHAVDAIEPVMVVDEIHVDYASIILIDEQELEINTKADAIEPFNLVDPVNVQFVSNTMPEEEILEIDHNMDAIEPVMVAQEIHVAYADNITVDEQVLEINTNTDAIKPSILVDPVNVLFTSNTMPEEELLEINTRLDAVEALAVAEPVLVAFKDQEIWMDEDIEINTKQDVVEAISLVEPVFVSETKELAIADEELEINLKSEALVALNQIKQVVFDEQAYADIEPEEEILELSLEDSYIKVHDIPQTIEIAQFSDVFPPEEQLEIFVEDEPVNMIAQVDPVEWIAFNDDFPYLDTEELEINLDNKEVPVIRLVNPINVEALAFEPILIENETLEIRMESENTQPVEIEAIVEPVYISAFAMVEPEEEALEIRFNKYEQLLQTMPEQVEPIYYSSLTPTEIELDESDIVINFGIDDQVEESLMASADNSLTVAERSKDISELPSLTTDVFYLRESVSLANEIESSRTDLEVLRTALTNPDDLDYEELLFAASLTSNAKDKLNIYNTAFVHLDRDWRAFNNAAVTSINSRNLDQAEVYLYQASLLSQDNGKIYNNMGILACYQSDFEKARDYFVTALQLGVNSEYNLQVLKNMTETNSFTTEQLHQEIGEHRYFEVLGELLNNESTR
jgi:Flp pilus assembly protein TadD